MPRVFAIADELFLGSDGCCCHERRVLYERYGWLGPASQSALARDSTLNSRNPGTCTFVCVRRCTLNTINTRSFGLKGLSARVAWPANGHIPHFHLPAIDMGPKKPLAGSPVKKKSKDHSKSAAIPNGDGHDKDPRGGAAGGGASAGGAGGGGAGGAGGDGSLSGTGQDNDEMDAYHEPVRWCLMLQSRRVLSEEF